MRGQRPRPRWRPASPAPWEDPGLRAAGLAVQRVVLPYPRRDGWRWLIPAEQLRHHRFRSGGARGLAGQLVLQSGLGTWLVRDYCVLAGPAPLAGPFPRTLGEALTPPGSAPPVTRALSDARVALLGGGRFLKLPLSPDQQRAVVAEVEKTELARTTAFAPFVVAGSRIERWRDVPYSVSPAIPGTAAGGAAAQATVLAALTALDAGRLAPLDATTFWTRLSSARGGRDADEIGAAALRAAVLEACAGRAVPVGPTHGDLHPGNVLVQPSGPGMLVDWNRFELENPLLLDAVYAAVRGHMVAAGVPFAPALLAFVDGELTGPVADRASGLLGELSPLEGATVLLLDRLVSYSLPRRRYKPWTMPRLQQAVLAVAARTGEEDRRPPPRSP